MKPKIRDSYLREVNIKKSKHSNQTISGSNCVLSYSEHFIFNTLMLTTYVQSTTLEVKVRVLVRNNEGSSLI